MLHFLLPSLVGFGAILGLAWAGFRCLLPSKATTILALAFLLIWILFACNLMFAFLD